MGLFDNVLVENMGLPELPEEKLKELQTPKKLKIEGYGEMWEDHNEAPEINRTVFQTKSLDSSMSTYVLTPEGLFDRRYQYEEVPPEKRPYYGTREWEEGDEKYRNENKDREENFVFRLAWLHGPEYYQEYGSRRMVEYKDLNIRYHGYLTFYATHKKLGLPEEAANYYSLVEYVARLREGELIGVRKPAEIDPHQVYGGSYITYSYGFQERYE
jgi:hypothetical protein